MDEVDVLIIGAGAAGSVVARALAETKLNRYPVLSMSFIHTK